MAENNERRPSQDGVTERIDAVLGERRRETPVRRTVAGATGAAPAERAPVRRPAPQGARAPQARQGAQIRSAQAQQGAQIRNAQAQQGAQVRSASAAAPQGAGRRIVPDYGKGAPPRTPAASPDRTSSAAQSAKPASPDAGRRIVPDYGKGVRQPKAAPADPNAGRRLHDPERAATRRTDAIKAVEEKEKEKEKNKKGDSDVGGTIVSGILRTVIYLVSVTVVAVILSIFIINVGNDAYAFVKPDEAIDVTIPEGATRGDIADILYDNGVINYKTAFKIYGSIKHIEENFVAGEYTVSPMMNYKDLYNAFKPKPVSGTTWVTIPEGYTVDEIINLMLSKGIGGTKQDYVDAINKGDFSEFWFVKELEEKGYSEDRFYRLEGYLFPDTYEFYNASSAYTVVRKMLKRFDEIYSDKLRARADEIGWTTDQVVILASMIEREAGLSSDFRNISAVFHNRLKTGGGFLFLSSDATAVYAIQHDTGERPKTVTAEMMEYDSPYNTYLHQGLPPGAIANPGMNALKYALYPNENSSYLYFVSLPSGETLYANNEWEHNQNVQRLRAEQGN